MSKEKSKLTINSVDYHDIEIVPIEVRHGFIEFIKPYSNEPFYSQNKKVVHEFIQRKWDELVLKYK